LLTPEYVAVRVTEVERTTLPVLTVKVAEVAPADTLTLEGTEARLDFELDNATTAPPEPAAAVNVTLPVAEVPPVTEVGLMEIEPSAAVAAVGFTVNVAVLLAPE
jgi:hypothetical protein